MRTLSISILMTGLFFSCTQTKDTSDVNFYAKGMTAYKSGNFLKAIDYFDQGIAKDKGNDRLYFYKALCFGYLNEYDKSIETFGLAIESKPEHGRYNMFRGHAYRYIGDLQKASEDYDQAFKKSTSIDLEMYYSSGTLKLELGDTIGACQKWKVIYGQGHDWADSLFNVNCK